MEAWIDSGGAPIYPDSLGALLDDDSLGVLPNPALISEVPVGLHRIKTFASLLNQTYFSPVQTVFVEVDLTTTVNAQLTRTGVLIISATVDGIPVDSMGVKLDGDTIGMGVNPYSAERVTQGTHKLVVFASRNGGDWEGWLKEVQVTAAETTYVDVPMVAVGPDSGAHAPDLNCLDLDGGENSLSDHWGKVIYLYFFEHT